MFTLNQEKLFLCMEKSDNFSRGWNLVYNHAGKRWGSGTCYKSLWKLILIHAAIHCAIFSCPVQFLFNCEKFMEGSYLGRQHSVKIALPVLA